MTQGSNWKRGIRTVILIGLAAPIALAAGNQSEQPDKVDASAAYRGEPTYRTYCSSCHGKQARGDGPLANDLKVPPANLSELAARHEGQFPFAMVLETIEHGRSVRGHGSQDMPAWGDAFEMTSQSEAEATAKMKELAHFLWSLQVKP